MTLSSRYLVDAESIRRAQRGLKLAVEVGLDLADHIGCIHGAIDAALALELASGPGIAGEEDLVASLDARHLLAFPCIFARGDQNGGSLGLFLGFVDRFRQDDAALTYLFQRRQAYDHANASGIQTRFILHR